MKTRLSALAAAVSSLSMLTACGGGGGGASGDIPEYTPAPVTYYSSSAGMWEGTEGSNSVSGIVSPEGAYWFVYSTNGSTPSGFYTGEGNDDSGSGSSDGLAGEFESPQVLKFDFEGDTSVRSGAFIAQYGRTSVTSTEPASPYTTANSLSGEFKPNTAWDIEMNASVYFPAANGPLNMVGFTGTWDSESNVGSWTGTTTIPGFSTTMHYTQTFTINDNTSGPLINDQAGRGYLNSLDISSCTANTDSACQGFSSALTGNFRNTAVNPSDVNVYKTPVAFTPTDGWTGQWTLQVNKVTENGVEYIPMPMNVTLRASSGIPLASAVPVATQYNPLYEEEALVPIIAGEYTAGWTGINAVRYSAASLTIADNPATTGDVFDGVIEGSAVGSSCSYAGTIIPHLTGGGNFYDVKKLAFSDAEGGSCPYTGIEFTGVAVYDSGKLTLTAINADNNKGFMVVATKP